MFQPNFRVTGSIANALVAIEADRQVVTLLPLTAPMLDSLRRTARLLSTHLSTQIEGNQLSAVQVAAVVRGEGNFPGMERDEAEIRNHFAAAEYVEVLGQQGLGFTESELRNIHGLVMTGRATPTPYRGGQNVIREASSGRVVYMPPEAKDVPGLVAELVEWAASAFTTTAWPPPILAALVHYQFATIHPYFDGNGRTARLLTNLVLHRSGYGLNGIYSLEEYYSANLDGYYRGLAVGPSHNYYLGRVEGEVTAFIEYFCVGMANALHKVRRRAETAPRSPVMGTADALRTLTPQQRRSFGLFLRARHVTAADVAAYFDLSPRRGSALCARWVAQGFLIVHDPSTKGRSYRLADSWEALVVAQAEAQREGDGG
ncbi:cell division protein Fic [Deltaproteobacteria bacterium]|nr:cell division protein Fic [Deltaproteobacteria bacterium]